MQKRSSIFAAVAIMGAGLLPCLAQEGAIGTDSNAATSTVAQGDQAQGVAFPYALLDMALAERVDKNGRVNYGALKGDKNLAAFLAAVATADVSRFPTFETKPKLDADGKPIDAPTTKKRGKDKNKVSAPQLDRTWEMVFWINATNAHTLKTISDAYPIKSVGDIKEFALAKTHLVAGKNYSLAELREKVASFDRRAIFTLSDGTLSGPILLGRAYRSFDINSALEAAVSAVVNNPKNVQLTRIQNKVVVSDFFQTVNDTFKSTGNRKKWEGIRYLLSLYVDQNADRKYFTTNDYAISFTPRDTQLNDSIPTIGS